MNKTYTAADVMALTGITQRQLQWWDEKGFLVPSRALVNGRANTRVYSAEQLKQLRRFAELRRDCTFLFKGITGEAILQHRGPVRFINGPVLIGKTLVIPREINGHYREKRS